MIQKKKTILKAAEIIKSLGHPARIEILVLLNNKQIKKMTVTQIYEELGLTQPETSRHLSILKNSSVLRCEKDGSHSYYFINEEDFFISGIANCMSNIRKILFLKNEKTNVL